MFKIYMRETGALGAGTNIREQKLSASLICCGRVDWYVRRCVQGEVWFLDLRYVRGRGGAYYSRRRPGVEIRGRSFRVRWTGTARGRDVRVNVF